MSSTRRTARTRAQARQGPILPTRWTGRSAATQRRASIFRYLSWLPRTPRLLDLAATMYLAAALGPTSALVALEAHSHSEHIANRSTAIAQTNTLTFHFPLASISASRARTRIYPSVFRDSSPSWSSVSASASVSRTLSLSAWRIKGRALRVST